jgi:hypothetical protein
MHRKAHRDPEGAVGVVAFEDARGVQGMHYREAQPPAGLEDPGRLADRAADVIDVLQRHERDHEVDGPVSERDPSGVSPAHGDRRLARGRRLDHRGRRIQTHHPMTKHCEVARQTPFAAAQIERPASGLRHDRHEEVLMEPVVAASSR